MSEYQEEQREALVMIRKYLGSLKDNEREDLGKRIAGYLGFRQDVDAFLDQYFSSLESDGYIYA